MKQFHPPRVFLSLRQNIVPLLEIFSFSIFAGKTLREDLFLIDFYPGAQLLPSDSVLVHVLDGVLRCFLFLVNFFWTCILHFSPLGDALYTTLSVDFKLHLDLLRCLDVVPD